MTAIQKPKMTRPHVQIDFFSPKIRKEVQSRPIMQENNSEGIVEIDENLTSRQIAVLGSYISTNIST